MTKYCQNMLVYLALTLRLLIREWGGDDEDNNEDMDFCDDAVTASFYCN
jgi:hypothetical protein